MKAFLVFPPHWVPTMPHLALPTLSAFLRSQGMEVIQRDLNLEVFDAILTESHLNRIVTHLRESPPPSLSREARRLALDAAPRLVDRVESAKAVMRDPRFYDGRTGRRAFFTLIEGLEFASLPFHPASLQLTQFTPAAPVDSSRRLLQAVRNPRSNPFLDLFRRIVLPEIIAEEPDIVGISIPTLRQMLAGLTLGHLIKQSGLSCHVTLGGPHISMVREQLPQTPDLFDCFDSAVVFSGETTLLRLAEALDGDGELASVPNLIYREERRGDARVRTTPVAWSPSPDLTPDFDGLPLDRYLTPHPVLPLLSAHGCYHGKCAFCNVGYGGGNRFRPVDPERVAAQMRALHERYGARHFFFADEAMTPRNLRVMSERLAGIQPTLHWCGCVRFEPTLTGELLAAMAEGGCRMLLFGLESAASSTIERMHKGTRVDTISRVLRDSAEAGIWNHAFFFFGFPGETMDAAQETVNFVYAHQDAIHSASPGAFLLERYSPAHQDPASYGITRIVENPDRDLAIYFDYEVASGLNESMADTLASRLVDVLPEKKFGQYYITDAYRLLYASHLWEQGEPMPLWLV
jgi:hypothetical protein